MTLTTLEFDEIVLWHKFAYGLLLMAYCLWPMKLS